MAREWAWKLAEIMSDSQEAVDLISKHVAEVPDVAASYAWATRYAGDVEAIVCDTLYRAAYDYSGVGTFRGWWIRKLSGQIGKLVSEKKNREFPQNPIRMAC